MFIAIGASCSGDVVRLQQLISTGYNLDFFEPFSAFTIKVLNIFFINQSSAILHFLAIFLIIFSFRLYFLSTALISKKNFYFISFIFIFNPLTLLLVTNNTRQLFFSSSIPKVVFDKNGYLLYMSRGPIPSNKALEFRKAWRQVCAYSFPRKALIDFTKTKNKTPIELLEDIEILRFLENGYKVKMIKMSNKSLAVDNNEDLEKAKIYLKYKKL